MIDAIWVFSGLAVLSLIGSAWAERSYRYRLSNQLLAFTWLFLINIAFILGFYVGVAK